MNSSPPGVGSQPWHPTTDVASALTAREGDGIVVLPVEIGAGGVGIYRDSQLLIVKALRARGVEADFLHTSDSRTFKGEYSSKIIAELALGVLGNMSWDALKATADYIGVWAKSVISSESDRVKVNVATIDRADGTRLKGVSVEAPGADAAATVLRAIKELADPESRDT